MNLKHADPFPTTVHVLSIVDVPIFVRDSCNAIAPRIVPLRRVRIPAAHVGYAGYVRSGAIRLRGRGQSLWLGKGGISTGRASQVGAQWRLGGRALAREQLARPRSRS